MDNSLQTYLDRKSSAELTGFLAMCSALNRWEDYQQVVPLIFRELQKRNISPSEQILSSWNAFLATSELS